MKIIFQTLNLLALLLCSAQLSFAQGKHSGIVGESLMFCCPVSGPGIECPDWPYPSTIAIYSENGRLLTTVDTGDDGLFIIYLKPGVYTIVPMGPTPPGEITPEPMDITVEKKQFTPVTIRYNCGAI